MILLVFVTKVAFAQGPFGIETLRDFVGEKLPNGNVDIGASSLSLREQPGQILAREYAAISSGILKGLRDQNLPAYFELPQLLGHPPQNPNDSEPVREPNVIGKRDFIHLEKDNGVWWLADHTGKRFVTTGMNHVGEGGVLFSEVNQGWLTGKFGEDIKGSWGGLNPRAKNHGGYADMVVKDFKDYSFNTIPFHAYSTPLNLYEERKIYYVAKIKVQSISLMGMNRARGDRFPDVFAKDFRDELDALAKKVCPPLRNAKYCLGYAYFDMPDLKPARRWHQQMFPDGGLVYPWVQDMRELPTDARGKQEWIRILKRNHASAVDASRVYAVNNVTSWDDLAKVTSWPIKPNDVARVRKDADDMLTALAEKWYGLHHELIRKYDPNHLLLGDKHDVGYGTSVDMIPNGVLSAIGKHCDVLTIQYYTFYTDQHNATIRELHRKSGLPIINGDHAYSFMTSKHTKIKGLEVDSFVAVANEYRRYLKGSMEDHPYMLGWWYCGYIEQWAPAGTKQLGQQCGFFNPFGKPNEKLLALVKEANENAAKWHVKASTKVQPMSAESAPQTPAEMFTALQLTAEQQTKLDAIEKERKAAESRFRALGRESRTEERDKFYAQRKKKLQELFTDQQWTIWSRFWSRQNK